MSVYKDAWRSILDDPLLSTMTGGRVRVRLYSASTGTSGGGYWQRLDDQLRPTPGPYAPPRMVPAPEPLPDVLRWTATRPDRQEAALANP